MRPGRFTYLNSKVVPVVLMLAIALYACAGQVAAPGQTAEPTPDGKQNTISSRASGIGTNRPAPELRGTGAWINSEPFTLESQRGRVVLIDFWTYTCINCIRTLPHLKAWHEKYRDNGLLIVGVHSPEFQFEHDVDNLRRAVVEEGITWPVVQDNAFETWDAYNNFSWPAKYLIDKDGVMRHYYGGEGGYDLTERRIRALLEEAGYDISDIEAPPISKEEPSFDSNVETSSVLVVDFESEYMRALDPTFRESKDAEVTSELPAGYVDGCKPRTLSNSKVDDESYCESKGVAAIFEDSGDRRDHMLYIQGAWLNGSESLRHARDTEHYEDYLLLRFASKSVNVVTGPVASQVKVLVTLDGQYLRESNKGEDVTIEEDGRSFLVLDDPRMHNLLVLPAYGVHELKLSPSDAEFEVFAFTFGVYSEGP